MTKNERIKELQLMESNLQKKQIPDPTILELQIATFIEDLEIFQTKNYSFFGMTDFLGEVNSKIILNFDAKTVLKQLKTK
jgi:hypothetical protein